MNMLVQRHLGICAHEFQQVRNLENFLTDSIAVNGSQIELLNRARLQELSQSAVQDKN